MLVSTSFSSRTKDTSAAAVAPSPRSGRRSSAFFAVEHAADAARAESSRRSGDLWLTEYQIAHPHTRLTTTSSARSTCRRRRRRGDDDDVLTVTAVRMRGLELLGHDGTLGNAHLPRQHRVRAYGSRRSGAPSCSSCAVRWSPCAATTMTGKARRRTRRFDDHDVRGIGDGCAPLAEVATWNARRWRSRPTTPVPTDRRSVSPSPGAGPRVSASAACCSTGRTGGGRIPLGLRRTVVRLRRHPGAVRHRLVGPARRRGEHRHRLRRQPRLLLRHRQVARRRGGGRRERHGGTPARRCRQRSAELLPHLFPRDRRRHGCDAPLSATTSSRTSDSRTAPISALYADRIRIAPAPSSSTAPSTRRSAPKSSRATRRWIRQRSARLPRPLPTRGLRFRRARPCRGVRRADAPDRRRTAPR